MILRDRGAAEVATLDAARFAHRHGGVAYGHGGVAHRHGIPAQLVAAWSARADPKTICDPPTGRDGLIDLATLNAASAPFPFTPPAPPSRGPPSCSSGTGSSWIRSPSSDRPARGRKNARWQWRQVRVPIL